MTMRSIRFGPWLRARARLVFAGVALLVGACGAAGVEPPPPDRLLVENASQYVVLELRLHASEGYVDAPSLLRAPLELGGTITTTLAEDVFITVFREHYRLGPTIALTTAERLSPARAHGRRLLVLDELFRLE
jgi:hypothetical protein